MAVEGALKTMKTSGVISRRGVLGAAAASALARPGLLRAQTASGSVRIGLLSDVAGPYRNVGGPGAKVAVELAVEDFGGSLLGRRIEVVQSDIQNKPDISSAKAREWIDDGFNVLVDGAVVGTFTPAGPAYQGYVTAAFTVAAGPHTITFQGLDTAGGDNTTFIDDVSVHFA